LFEIVDTETGQPLPDGQTGNIVITSLCRTIPPVIRLIPAILGGRIIRDGTLRMRQPLQAHGPIPRRSDDMVRMRGVNIYPMACLTAVRSDDVPPASGCASPSGPKAAASLEKSYLPNRVKKNAESREGMVEHIERRLKKTSACESSSNSSMRHLGEFTISQRRQARRLLDLRRKHEPKETPVQLSERYAKYPSSS